MKRRGQRYAKKLLETHTLLEAESIINGGTGLGPFWEAARVYYFQYVDTLIA